MINTEAYSLANTLIKNIFDDFKSFFIASKDAEFVRYQIQSGLSGPMLVRKTGSNAYIAISQDISELDLKSDVNKLLVLFMIGHELAHLVNKHLYYQETKNLDTKTIEMWADFFGAKIAMSIFQDGVKFNSMLELNYKDINIGIEALSNVLKNLYTKVYENTNFSKKYLNSHNRFSSTVGGIVAFLTRKEMVLSRRFSNEEHADVGFNWGIAFNNKLVDLGLMNELFEKDNTIIGSKEDEIKLHDLAKNVFKIHNKIKSDSHKLIKGLNPLHDYILCSSYGQHQVNTLMLDKFSKYTGTNIWNSTTAGIEK